MDDFEKDTMKYLCHYLKLWADPYGQITGEVKGSILPLSYEVLIVTSNYSIQKACQIMEDHLLTTAINRRFTEVNMMEMFKSSYTKEWIE